MLLMQLAKTNSVDHKSCNQTDKVAPSDCYFPVHFRSSMARDGPLTDFGRAHSVRFSRTNIYARRTRLPLTQGREANLGTRDVWAARGKGKRGGGTGWKRAERERHRVSVGRVSKGGFLSPSLSRSLSLSSPTYPKFQPVLPGFPFRRIFPLLPTHPLAGPPRCVSCGRLASPSVQQESSFIPRGEPRIVYGSLPSLPLLLLFRTRNRRPSLSLSLSLPLAHHFLSFTYVHGSDYRIHPKFTALFVYTNREDLESSLVSFLIIHVKDFSNF